jgi:hypothetical protein
LTEINGVRLVRALQSLQPKTGQFNEKSGSERIDGGPAALPFTRGLNG